MDPHLLRDNTPASTWDDWRWQLRHAVRDVAQLRDWLRLGDADSAAVARAGEHYPVAITPYYLSLAQTASPTDPILRQCLPAAAELDVGYAGDPFAEEGRSPVPGMVHRYPDRVLLVANDACAVHCRHCLRKRMWRGEAKVLDAGQLPRVTDYLDRNEVREVILSGGDPLLLSREQLGALVCGIRKARSVEVIRIGSRLPAVLPQRLTPDFCDWLGSQGLIWVATHFNHPRELTDAASRACENLVRAGIPVVNQAVLLRGVNDTADCIEALCRGLVRMRVKPYYLFHGDPIRGAGHFRTGIDAGLEIMSRLRGRMSGLACPVFAIDLPGGEGKVVLEPDRRDGETAEGVPRFSGLSGAAIAYECPLTASCRPL